jgi:putative phosphoribosyl transferase
MMTSFRDRADAGRELAGQLSASRLTTPLILGLPRGGIPVAAEIAAELDAPLEAFVAQKIGAPGHEELGVGAVAEGLREPVISPVAAEIGLSPDDVRGLAGAADAEVNRRIDRYRSGRPLPGTAHRDVVVVDDGLATGITAEAALRALRERDPARLVLAVPVGASQTVGRLTAVADEVICVEMPPFFQAVGQWYLDFSPLTDDEVVACLASGRGGQPES